MYQRARKQTVSSTEQMPKQISQRPVPLAAGLHFSRRHSPSAGRLATRQAPVQLDPVRPFGMHVLKRQNARVVAGVLSLSAGYWIVGVTSPDLVQGRAVAGIEGHVGEVAAGALEFGVPAASAHWIAALFPLCRASGPDAEVGDRKRFGLFLFVLLGLADLSIAVLLGHFGYLSRASGIAATCAGCAHGLRQTEKMSIVFGDPGPAPLRRTLDQG